MGGGDRVLDDARQLVREQLLSPRPDGRRGIESYSGRGSLRGWLKVTVTRRLLRVLRRDRREVPISADELFDAISSETDGPELVHLKDRYRDAFKRAFEDAIGGLTPQERNLLRYQFVDGLGSHEIGAVYGVHRATASRWLVLARESLLERTRASLRAELGVASSEIDSIVELVRSRIDLSLKRLLAEEAP